MPQATQHIERGVEFAASRDLEVPDLRGIVGGTQRLPEQQLSDAYFDTSDLRLWRQGITLRHRIEETPPEAAPAGLWVLDLQTEHAESRQELRWVGGRTEMPAEVVTALRGVTRRERVELVTELVTTSKRLLLRDHNSEIWAEVDDDTTAVDKGPRDGLTFRRLKVDLLGDEREQLDSVLAELRHAGARRADKERLGKILGADPAGKPDRSTRGKRATIGAVIGASIASDLDRLLDQDVALRLDPRDPPVHAVHQGRVATRRLRSDLKTLAPLLDPVWVRHTRAELKSVGEALGVIRDADVLTARLAAAGDADKGTASLIRRLGDEREQGAAALAVLIGSDRYLNLLDRLHAASTRPPLPASSVGRGNVAGRRAAAELPPLTREQWKTLRRRVRRAGKHPSDARLHRIRIAAKQVRYASELCEPVVGKPARRTTAAVKTLQDLLGDHHDLVTAGEWLRSAARELESDRTAASAAGALAGEQQRRAAELRREWRPTWSRVDRKENRRWMR